ncbi:MAG: GntR family transcriptional regulator [Deltaproteobacteria bacterium]|nr:GntR family transcriptional regulator [Deltaproteobacteria bacterium]
MQAHSNKEIIPLYSRITSSLRNDILNGRYEPGFKFPREEKLAKEFNVSRITIREALALLERESLINRHQGKGTFVSEKIPKIRRPICTSLSDIVNSTQQGKIKPLGIWTVKVGDTSIASDIRTFFGLTNEDPITKIHRVLMRDGAPLHFFENYMQPELASHITLEDIAKKKAIIRILQDKIDLKIGRGEMYIEAIQADPEIARILDCQVFDPFVRVQVYLYFPNGDPFEIVNYFIRAEYFKFKTDIDTIDF